MVFFTLHHAYFTALIFSLGRSVRRICLDQASTFLIHPKLLSLPLQNSTGKSSLPCYTPGILFFSVYILGVDMRLTALISSFKCFWPPFFCIVPFIDFMGFFFFSFKSKANNLGGLRVFFHYSFQIRRLSQQQHLPTAHKKIQSPKAHEILFKSSLIMACNPWEPAKLCSFPGGLLLHLQVSQTANALNQFGLWRPTRNPSFLPGLCFFQLKLPRLHQQ